MNKGHNITFGMITNNDSSNRFKKFLVFVEDCFGNHILESGFGKDSITSREIYIDIGCNYRKWRK